MLGTTEGRFAIDHPVMAEQGSKPGGEGSRFSKRGEVAVELECALAKGGLKSSDELTAEDTAEHRDGKEEGVAGGDPSGVAGSEATGGNDAVDMGMRLEPLIPGVQHAEETDLGAQMSGIASHFEQGCGAGAKQQVVDELLVLQGKVCQFARQSKDYVYIAGGQQLAPTCLQPAVAGISLALWAMPVSARVVGDGGRLSAAGTAITVSAERSGTAAGDGQQHLLMLPGDPVATALNECLPRTANDVGHLQERATHLGLWRRLSFLLLSGQNQGVQRAGGGAEMAFGQMQVDGGFFQIVMP